MLHTLVVDRRTLRIVSVLLVLWSASADAGEQMSEGFPEAIALLQAGESRQAPPAVDVSVSLNKRVYAIPYWCDAPGLVRFILRFPRGGVVWTRIDSARAGRNWLEFGNITRDKGQLLHLSMHKNGKEYRLPLRLR